MSSLKHEPSLQELYSSVHNQLYASHKELYICMQMLEEIARPQQLGMLYHRMQRPLAAVQVRLQQAALELRQAGGQLEEENAEMLAQQRRQKELEIWEQSLYARQQQLDALQADLDQRTRQPDPEQLRSQIEEMEQRLQEGQARLEQLQQQEQEMARRQADLDQKARMLCLRQEQLEALEASLNGQAAARQNRQDALAVMGDIRSAMLEIQKAVRTVGPAFGDLTERVNGGFVAEGVRDLIRCSRSLRQLGGEEGKYYIGEIERILTEDFGCEKIWPAAGEAIDLLTMTKLNIAAPGDRVQAVVYGGWRMEETVLEKAVILPAKE